MLFQSKTLDTFCLKSLQPFINFTQFFLIYYYLSWLVLLIGLNVCVRYYTQAVRAVREKTRVLSTGATMLFARDRLQLSLWARACAFLSKEYFFLLFSILTPIHPMLHAKLLKRKRHLNFPPVFLLFPIFFLQAFKYASPDLFTLSLSQKSSGSCK